MLQRIVITSKLFRFDCIGHIAELDLPHAGILFRIHCYWMESATRHNPHILSERNINGGPVVSPKSSGVNGLDLAQIIHGCAFERILVNTVVDTIEYDLNGLHMLKCGGNVTVRLDVNDQCFASL